jgi:hypothetical protein
MQTFLPYADFRKSFKVLDYKRLGKQRAEAITLINVINGVMKDGQPPKGWINHPITIMWRPYIDALKLYTNLCIEEWKSRGYQNSISFFEIEEIKIELPDWLGFEPFHASHRSNLLKKDYEFYKQYDWIEDPNDPYIWRDQNGRWYQYIRESKSRKYLEP